jgi:hypothetical protein
MKRVFAVTRQGWVPQAARHAGADHAMAERINPVLLGRFAHLEETQLAEAPQRCRN